MKKGLTLIELLATIVILAIILIISIPMIIDVISEVKEKSLVISVEQIEKEIDKIIFEKESNQISGQIIISVANYNTIETSNEVFDDFKFSKNIKDGYIKIENDNSYEIIITDGAKVISKSNSTEKTISDYTEGCCKIVIAGSANIQYEETNEIYLYPTFTSSVRFDQTIGQRKNEEYFSVLSFNEPGYDERGLLKFNIPFIAPETIESVELFAYYYTGDIPSRQQTHPVRRVTVPWTETDYLPNSSMTDTYNCRMTSLDTSNYGYGWRKCNINDIFTHWITNPSENYGLVIDHNRGLQDAGGWWNKMQYYSMNADNDFIPYIKIKTKTNFQKPYIILEADFTSSVRFDQTIGQKKNEEYFSVLTFNEPGYDERGLLKFDIPNLSGYEVIGAELYSYYYTGDIPSRQQTHPVRRVTVPWIEADFLPNSSMTDDYNCRMTSLDTSNYGYGWRKCNVVDIVKYWKNNPSENYGLVIDHNRGQQDAGGWWNKMQYYSKNSADYKPYLRVDLKQVH